MSCSLYLTTSISSWLICILKEGMKWRKGYKLQALSWHGKRNNMGGTASASSSLTVSRLWQSLFAESSLSGLTGLRNTEAVNG